MIHDKMANAVEGEYGGGVLVIAPCCCLLLPATLGLSVWLCYKEATDCSTAFVPLWVLLAVVAAWFCWGFNRPAPVHIGTKHYSLGIIIFIVPYVVLAGCFVCTFIAGTVSFMYLYAGDAGDWFTVQRAVLVVATLAVIGCLFINGHLRRRAQPASELSQEERRARDVEEEKAIKARALRSSTADAANKAAAMV